MDERQSLFVDGALYRAQRLVDLLNGVKSGSADAAAQLALECRQVPYEGAVWCLPCDAILSDVLDAINAGEQPATLALHDDEACDLGAGPQPPKGA